MKVRRDRAAAARAVRFGLICARFAAHAGFVGIQEGFSTATTGRLRTDRTPTSGRLRAFRPRPLRVVHAAQGLDIDQAAQVTLRIAATVVQQLVLERLAAAATVYEQIFELDQATQVDL